MSLNVLEQVALPCFPGSSPAFPSLRSSVFLPADRYGSEQEFVDDLKNMWFGLYSRGNEEEDSSGFEHVFSGGIIMAGKKELEERRETASLRRRAASGTEELAAKPISRDGPVHPQVKKKGSEELFLRDSLPWSI